VPDDGAMQAAPLDPATLPVVARYTLDFRPGTDFVRPPIGVSATDAGTRAEE
jgi:hypothetical protein